MKRKSVIAALVLALPLLAQTAQAYQENPYTFACTGPACVSPFTTDHTAPPNSGRTAPTLYQLTGKDDHSLLCYSVDAAGKLPKDTEFRRMNLEDSPWFSDATAEKLRAIVKKGYPMVSVEKLQEEASLWLRERGLPEIVNLQTGEAISAAQIAIWKLSGGSGYRVDALYSGVADPEESSLPQQETEYTAGNIEGLYTYFCNLQPMSPETVLLSDASITRTVYSAARDSAYAATVSVTVNVTVGEGDDLTLSAACEDQRQEQGLTESGEYTFTFSGLSGHSPVTITLSGTQHGADVYLFDVRGEGQTLLGYDDSVQPIYSERILTPVPSGPSA